MKTDEFVTLRNAQAITRHSIPHVPFEAFRRWIINGVSNGLRIVTLFGDVSQGVETLDLYAVLAHNGRGLLMAAKTSVAGEGYPSLTPECPQAHLFEREIAEQYGAIPHGHPWLKPVRFHTSYRPGHDAWGRQPGTTPLVGVTDFFRIEGEEIHEVAVGPVHAGVIEPGHFRFQCHGEHVFHLEISLGYQHRGIERALVGGPNKRTLHLMESVAGDTSIGHATAYCEALEALGGCQVPLRAAALRGIALELERLANHTGDLGALANDVAYLPTASYCGRIRGDFLNLTALLCGSRFGRGFIRPGGVGFDLECARQHQCQERLQAAIHDARSAVNLLWESASVQARFDGTGAISRDLSVALGLVGPTARACGIECDDRQDFPTGIYRFAQVPVTTWQTGDVFARAYVRGLEMQRSAEFVRAQLAAIPAGPIRAVAGPLRAEQFVVTLVEGWRGEICHVCLTGGDGRISRYKIVDPSFRNWTGLAMALRDQQISDFPLCNKSFNLSYCGHDL